MFDVNEMGGGEATAERGTKDADVAQSLYISALHYYADTVVLQSLPSCQRGPAFALWTDAGFLIATKYIATSITFYYRFPYAYL
jgi:hypothetical protein